MKKIQIFYNKEAHVSCLITGFHLLDIAGIFSVEFIENINNFRGTLHPQVVEAVIDGHIIAFDMCDAFRLNNDNAKEYLSKVALYFKRSYSAEMDVGLSVKELAKIRPFGFDYYATYSQNPIDSCPGFTSWCKKSIHDIFGYNKCMYVDAFEGKADYTDNPSILFMTRLWDPAEIELSSNLSPELRAYRQYMIEERIKINADRIHLIRSLKNEYGKSFFGGIQDCVFARTQCPDLILPRSQVRKRAYLSRMKHSDICIGSTGLHKSIGWKTGEYVAAARAIVAERFCYEVPGNFMENINYVPYDSTDECLAAIDSLFHKPEEIYKMKVANEQYYEAYLRPDVQIMNALKQLTLFKGCE